MPITPARKSPAKSAQKSAAKSPAKRAAKSPSKKAAKRKVVSFDTVREIFAELPGVEEGPCYGTPGFRVKGKFISRLKEDGDSLVVPVGDMIEREFLIETEPAIFYITEHYRNYPMVLVRLAKVDRAELREMLERAWRAKAPKKILQAYDAEK